MTEDLSVEIRLSAQRALLGNVPTSLRAVSVDADVSKIYFRCIFDGEPTETEWELLSEAAAEVIADFSEPYTIEEEYLHVLRPKMMDHLRHLVFLRHETED